MVDQGDEDHRVLLVDRAGAGRSALAALLGGITGVRLVGELSEPDLLAPAIQLHHPDVVVIDDRLVAATPLGVLDDARLIVVGLDDNPGFAARAEDLGAVAWVPKECAGAMLPALIACYTSALR